MLKNIEGVKFIKNKDYAFCHIEKLSDELKEIIRKDLAGICFGSSKAGTGRIMYSYSSTIREFIKRYNSKPIATQIGLIGELLTHILLTEMFTDFTIVSPYFNSEERSIKKGFDVVLTSKKKNVLWITEVKSGGLHKNKTANETIDDLLVLAQSNLYNRLNDESISLWHNAINGAKIALESNKDLKEAVVDILEDIGDKSSEGNLNGNDINVFLSGILFSSFDDSISIDYIKLKTATIIKQKKFNNVFILSIQKETYKKVYDFLKKEGDCK